jgi:hypothetical protein
MKHFNDIVYLLKFHSTLQKLYDEERTQHNLIQQNRTAL